MTCHYGGPNGLNTPIKVGRIPARPTPSFRLKGLNEKEMKFFARGFAPGCDTREIHKAIQRVGEVMRIEIQMPRLPETTCAWVIFVASSVDGNLVRNGVTLEEQGLRRYISFELRSCAPPHPTRSPRNLMCMFPERIVLEAAALGFGYMQSPDTMAMKQELFAAAESPFEVELDTKRKTLDIIFTISFESRSVDSLGAVQQQHRRYRLRLELAQMREITQLRHEQGIAFVFSVEMPPLVYRKINDPLNTHEKGATQWLDRRMWYRQTGIYCIGVKKCDTATQLHNKQQIIDAGRCLTYRLILDPKVASAPVFEEMSQALIDHDIHIENRKELSFDSHVDESVWTLLDGPPTRADTIANSSSLSELYEMAYQTVLLSFEIRYQLEVCISNGFFIESNISESFLRRLQSMEDSGEKDRAVRLLEKVAEQKRCFYDPNQIFGSLQLMSGRHRHQLPSYCAMFRSAVVTPTTIYFMNPVLEATNRIVRQYHQYQDRFLRVRFTDERYKGRIRGLGEDQMDEVFTRIKATMTHGIRVGGRHYEFLAFGNSQFREHGAYFFASTSDLCAADIRARMGTFSHISVVAKYCARLGQCFSTTRASSYGFKVKVEKLAEIERDGHCFSDGVGKISPFLARIIACELGLSTFSNDYPSAFQFRLAGCKGVLTVDPALSGSVVQIRPSQEKFPAENRGLEICRISRFSAAFLNIQLILVLSALGIEDHVFSQKMAGMLTDLDLAMVDKHKAIELLRRNVDFNQMTLQIASMISDGFMEVKDPFTISCIRLWRSWTTKYLKEKARILVDDGAFVLGVIDETGSLKGHVNSAANHDEEAHDTAILPEIFLQISDPQGKRPPNVIEGVCVLVRNPALHPGDSRVVIAVNKPELLHIKDCVVLPQTGDRPLANMCSGGDLDGDDYLVIWDQDLLPPEWNHPAMDYNPPDPVVSVREPIVEDMTTFFVNHMKYDNLARIAVAHRYWADFEEDGVKNEKCLRLAQLHSKAVDYAKTGVAAEFPTDLRVYRWPHWSEKKVGTMYRSNKVLGRLYDMVQRVVFQAAWGLPFDERILNAYSPDSSTLKVALNVKQEYDDAMRRIMARFSVKSEFEVWTTFALEHTDSSNDYKFAETIGEAVRVLNESHRKQCFEAAGTTEKDREWSKMAPFITAMYRVTADELQAALVECKKVKLVESQWVVVKEMNFETMPLISFPWLFPTELGWIANRSQFHGRTRSSFMSNQKTQPSTHEEWNILTEVEQPAPLQEIRTAEAPVREGDILTLFDNEEHPASREMSSTPERRIENETTSPLRSDSGQLSYSPETSTLEVPAHSNALFTVFDDSEACTPKQNRISHDKSLEAKEVLPIFDDGISLSQPASPAQVDLIGGNSTEHTKQSRSFADQVFCPPVVLPAETTGKIKQSLPFFDNDERSMGSSKSTLSLWPEMATAASTEHTACDVEPDTLLGKDDAPGHLAPQSSSPPLCKLLIDGDSMLPDKPSGLLESLSALSLSGTEKDAGSCLQKHTPRTDPPLNHPPMQQPGTPLNDITPEEFDAYLMGKASKAETKVVSPKQMASELPGDDGKRTETEENIRKACWNDYDDAESGTEEEVEEVQIELMPNVFDSLDRLIGT